METVAVVTDQTGSVAVPVAVRTSSSMRTINMTMRDLSGSFRRSEPIAFFCECDSPTCFSAVWMSPDVYDATVASHTGWMLLEGHEPSALWHTSERPPTLGTGGALRAVPDAEHEAPQELKKHRSAFFHDRLARAS